jgi:hypothetical protein
LPDTTERRAQDRETKVSKALESTSQELRTMLDSAPDLLFVPSELTMKRRRSVTVLSLAVIVFLVPGMTPTEITPLGISFDEAHKDFFVIGAAITLVYQLAMYVTYWNRDVIWYELRGDITGLALIASVRRALLPLEGGRFDQSDLPPDFTAAARSLEDTLEGSESRLHRRLHLALLRWPPAIMCAAALTFLLLTYLPLPVFLGILLVTYAVKIVWRFSVRGASGRASR